MTTEIRILTAHAHALLQSARTPAALSAAVDVTLALGRLLSSDDLINAAHAAMGRLPSF